MSEYLSEETVPKPTQVSQNQSWTTNELVAALAKAQASIVPPERNKTVTVTPRSGGPGYSFRYATLGAIFEAIRKPFSENGLWPTQIISHDAVGGFYKLRTTLWHSSGQFISSEVPIIAEGSTNQQFGSAVTYMKRYMLSAMVGIAADEDDDGNIADGNEIKAAQEKAPKPPAPNVIKPAPKPVVSEPMNKDLLGKIDVVAIDDANMDWMGWGRQFISVAEKCLDMDELKTLEANNAVPLKNMETQVPKIFSNLMIALIRIKQNMAKKT